MSGTIEKKQPIVILITAKDREEAERIAQALVKAKLAACVNIKEDIKSFFWWEGKIDKADEALLIVKSLLPLLDPIIKSVKALHSYSVPEIIALPIVGGNEEYLKWIEDSTQK